MVKKTIITILFSLVIITNTALTVFSQNFKGTESTEIIQDPQDGFSLGETLLYSIEWLGIPIGTIVLKVENIVTVNNRQCYHVIARTMPNRFFRKMYDLEYEVHSYIDRESLLTIRFEKVRRLKNELDYVGIDFDQKKGEVQYRSSNSSGFIDFYFLREKTKSNNPVTQNIPKGTQDLLSSLYYLRVLEIKENSLYPLNIYYNQRNWPIKMKVEKPFSRDFYRKGSFAIVKVSPVTDLSDYILGKKQVTVYLTVDPRRIPIEFKLDTAMGAVRGILKELPQ